MTPSKFCYRLLAAGFVLQLVGCGLFTDRTDSYVEARRAPAIVVPPTLSDENLRDDYSIPRVEQQRTLAKEFEIPPPPEVEADVLEEAYSIRRSDDQVWLLIGEEPGRVWPALGRFWSGQGLDVAGSVPRAGLVLTAATGADNRSRELAESLSLDPDHRYRFQVKLERGLKRGTSEVAVRVLPAEPSAGGLEQVWREATLQPEAEEKLLEQLMAFMEKDEAGRSYSLVAQDIAAGPKVSLETESEQPYLQLELGFDRAWNSIGKALEEARVGVVDFNRSEGVYLVSFDPGSESGSWVRSWFSSDNKAQLSDRYNYRLILEPSGDGIRVRAEGRPEETDREGSIQLLTRIFENIT